MRISDVRSDVCASDLRRPFYFVALVLLRHLRDNVGHPNFKVNQRHCAMAPRLIASREACMKTRLSLIIAIVAMFSLPAQASAALAIGSQAPDFTTNGALAGKVFKLHLARSEERRVGNKCFSTCRSRGSPYH